VRRAPPDRAQLSGRPRSLGRGGEVDLILRDRDGTLVFVEVRARADARHGGAAATVGAPKQRRLIFAAQHFLSRLATLPPCRFDVVTVEGERIEWLRAGLRRLVKGR
jgi:putative endonuclease